MTSQDRTSPVARRTAMARFKAGLLASAMAVIVVVPTIGMPHNALAQAPAPSIGSTAPASAGLTPAALPSFRPLVDKVLPAVVNISVTQKISASDEDTPAADQQQDDDPGVPPGMGSGSPFDEMLRRFFQNQRPGQRMPQQGQRVALGSGFVIDPSGYVVTNNHVVGNADKVTVIFQDDTKHPAKIIGRDPKTDLALLKIDAPKPLPYVQFGDSAQAQVGDWVLAVGNPFGLGGTVTTGIISARGRDIHEGPFDDFLQIDASINRGNSGGPTFDLSGHVIGINTAIYSPNGGSVGIGFAIPANVAQQVIGQLKNNGKVTRGWMGVQIQQITPEIAQSLGQKSESGALVADVTPDSPAAKAGIKVGDVIEKFDGQTIDKLRDLPKIVADTGVGKTVDLEVLRGGSTVTLRTTIAELPEKQQVASTEAPDGGNPAAPAHTSALGLQFGSLSDQMRHRLHIAGNVKGTVVTHVEEGSEAEQLGIQAGDVITAINQKPIDTPDQAATQIKAARDSGRGSLLLLLNRNGSNQYVALSTGKANNNG
ncbi:MAG TPA: DegQ family serine endoprotease [Stellaceae bacterium]|nr:DegQ family serine endoprotease [Stellaceae bacterium]